MPLSSHRFQMPWFRMQLTPFLRCCNICRRFLKSKKGIGNASENKAANVTGILDGGFLPKAATRKSKFRRGNLSRTRNSKFAIRNCYGSFPEFILGWTIEANGV
jgi:hypothetical protein